MPLLSNWMTDAFNPLFRAIEKADVALFDKYVQKWKATQDITSLRNSKGETLLTATLRQVFITSPDPALIGMVQHLLRLGANPNTPDFQGYSALSYLIGYIPNDQSQNYVQSRNFGVKAEEFYFGEYHRVGRFADEYVELGEGQVRFFPYLLDMFIEGQNRVEMLDWSMPLFDAGDGSVYPRLPPQDIAEVRAWALAKSKQWGEALAQNLDFKKPSIFFQETLLFEASRQGNLSIIQALIDKGVDVSHHNRDGKTARDVAHFKNKAEVQSLLEQVELRKNIPEAAFSAVGKTLRL